MYRCTECQTIVPPCTPQHLKIETRPARYPLRPEVYLIYASSKTYKLDDPGGAGHEIASARPVCPSCAATAATITT